LLLVGDHDVLLDHDSVFRPVRSSLHRDQVVDRGNTDLEAEDLLHRRLGFQLVVARHPVGVAEDVEIAMRCDEGEV
jgi:hypothetical protein